MGIEQLSGGLKCIYVVFLCLSLSSFNTDFIIFFLPFCLFYFEQLADQVSWPWNRKSPLQAVCSKMPDSSIYPSQIQALVFPLTSVREEYPVFK